MTSKEFYKTYQADDGMSPLSWELLAHVTNLLPNHVLEFGCGTGKHLAVINSKAICTIGIDISPANVYKAIHKYDLPCVIIGDETYLRHLCNVDVVFTCSVLDHIEDVAGIVDEFKRIANKAVIIAETNSKQGDYYYPHMYEEAYGFEKLDYIWDSPEDGCRYNIWIFKK